MLYSSTPQSPNQPVKIGENWVGHFNTLKVVEIIRYIKAMPRTNVRDSVRNTLTGRFHLLQTRGKDHIKIIVIISIKVQ